MRGLFLFWLWLWTYMQAIRQRAPYGALQEADAVVEKLKGRKRVYDAGP